MMNHNQPKKIAFLIPLYNHDATIKSVVTRAIATGYPVIVIDDGSRDNSWQQIKNLDCKVIQLPKNQGKGNAILTGARYAAAQNFDAILTLDADNQHDPNDARKLISEAESGEWPSIIIGDREMIQDTVPRSSHFGRKFSNFWVRLESGYDLPDTQSGMRLYPVKALLQLKLSRNRYDFEIEVLVKALWAGIDVRSVPISVHYPPATERISHFDKIKDNWRLTKVHTALIFRRLLPIPHHRLTAKKDPISTTIIIKNPWQTLKNLCRENASPFWLGVAIWFGVFLGALPLIACHTIAIIYVSYRFHLNKVAAVAASQFCMPPIVPALCIETGYYLRTGQLLLDFSWEHWLTEIHYRLWDWFLGSLIVGPLLGLVLASIVYWGARRFRSQPIEQIG